MATDIPSVDSVYREALREFEVIYKAKATHVGIAPGRVNLIGEHTDYNDGFVMPVALPMVTIIVGRRAPAESQLNVSSVTTLAEDVFGDETTIHDVRTVTYSNELIDPEETEVPKHKRWANYFKGVIYYFQHELRKNNNLKVTTVPPFNALIISSVPICAGLSSSAALEVAMYCFLRSLVGDKGAPQLDAMGAAKLCQLAEQVFANVPCGIMDQAISACGREDHALLLNCQDDKIVQEPFNLKSHQLVLLVTNSHVKHDLSSGQYAKRRATCEEAARILGVPSLREAKLEKLKNLLLPAEAGKSKSAVKEGGEEMLRCARHVVSEITRTREAGEYLKRGEFKQFGELMNQSHVSLRDDYEVSCKEVDVLVGAAQNLLIGAAKSSSGEGGEEEGVVFGSRMTGGGFGGCLVTLLRRDGVERVIAAMNKVAYKTPTHYVVERAGKGALYGLCADIGSRNEDGVDLLDNLKALEVNSKTIV